MSKNNINPPAEEDAPPAYTPHAETPYNPDFFAVPSCQRNEPPHTPSSQSEPSAPHSPFVARTSQYPQLHPAQHAHSIYTHPQPVYQTFEPQQSYNQQNYRQGRNDAEYSPLTARRNDAGGRGFPIGALLFLFGWLCPLLWICGACCCSGSRNPYEAWWGKLNFIMTIILIMSSIICSIFAVSFGDWISFGDWFAQFRSE